MSVCKKPQDSRFSLLGRPGRVWSISAIHGDLRRLSALHDALADFFRLGDRLVYLGNYTGYGGQGAACVDEILTFRRMLLARPGMRPTDIVYLRGQQEDMLHKLLQIQFSPNPAGLLNWALANGLGPTLESYAISANDGLAACRHGVLGLTRWSQSIIRAVRKHPGHEAFSTAQTRAAFTDRASDYPMLFVHAGIDPLKPVEYQGDNFWWADKDFSAITQPYQPFQKIVRGYDPQRKGLYLNCVTATIDGGCGFGGSLVAAGFDIHAQSVDLLEI